MNDRQECEMNPVWGWELAAGEMVKGEGAEYDPL
jgi:hypothetical protein